MVKGSESTRSSDVPEEENQVSSSTGSSRTRQLKRERRITPHEADELQQIITESLQPVEGNSILSHFFTVLQTLKVPTPARILLHGSL